MKKVFDWNTFVQWKSTMIKMQIAVEKTAASEDSVAIDDATTDANQQTAGVQIADQANQGLSYEELWRIIQYFSDWIKNGDVRIQMLLAVQGFIIAVYGALIPSADKINNFWNLWTGAWTALFVVAVLLSFNIGFFQKPNRTVKGDKGNIFFYGSYGESNESVDNLEKVSYENKINYMRGQISTLADIADKKFKGVQDLQTSVFLSAIFLTFFLSGFIPWVAVKASEFWCFSFIAVVALVVLLVFVLKKYKDINVLSLIGELNKKSGENREVSSGN